MATEATTHDETATPTDPSHDATVSRDDVFHLLQSARRRGVVRYLAVEGGPVEIGDLADQVAAWENDVSPEDVTSEQRQRVYIGLYQSHLDTLDDHDVVDYDDDAGVVTRAANTDALAAHLDAGATDADESSDVATAGSRSWLNYYLGFSLGGVASLLASTFLLVSTSLLSMHLISTFLVAAFGLTASMQYRSVR